VRAKKIEQICEELAVPWSGVGLLHRGLGRQRRSAHRLRHGSHPGRPSSEGGELVVSRPERCSPAESAPPRTRRGLRQRPAEEQRPICVAESHFRAALAPRVSGGASRCTGSDRGRERRTRRCERRIWRVSLPCSRTRCAIRSARSRSRCRRSSGTAPWPERSAAHLHRAAQVLNIELLLNECWSSRGPLALAGSRRPRGPVEEAVAGWRRSGPRAA